MNNALKRAIRTFVQAFLGSVLTSGVLSAIAVDGIVDFKVIEKVGASALAAGLIALITYVMNALEDNQLIPALLKNVPQEPKAAEADSQIVDYPPADQPPVDKPEDPPVQVDEWPPRLQVKETTQGMAVGGGATRAQRAKRATPVKKAAKKVAVAKKAAPKKP